MNNYTTRANIKATSEVYSLLDASIEYGYLAYVLDISKDRLSEKLYDMDWTIYDIEKINTLKLKNK